MLLFHSEFTLKNTVYSIMPYYCSVVIHRRAEKNQSVNQSVYLVT